ncbi:MAG: hypothetical protein ACK456_10725, partial [Pseudanabaenaceae cyanobacterium]
TNLGELMLPVSPPQNDQVPVGAIFALDADGIIHFTAVQFPLNSSVAPILNHAGDHDGSLDVVAAKALIASGEAKERSTTIDSGVTKK